MQAAFDLIWLLLKTRLGLAGVVYPTEAEYARQQASLSGINSGDIAYRSHSVAPKLAQLVSELVASLHPAAVDDSSSSERKV